MLKTIKVTEDDISQGQRGNGYACPIARAIKRVLPDAAIISVGDRHVHAYNAIFTPTLIASLPLQAQNFVYAFDDGRSVDPFTFELDVCKIT